MYDVNSPVGKVSQLNIYLSLKVCYMTTHFSKSNYLVNVQPLRGVTSYCMDSQVF